MNPHESELEYPWADVLPASGEAMELVPGVRWVRMGLPFALNHVNLWLVADGDGWAIIDCGIANDATRAAWEQVFEHALEGKPVTRVIVTHCHPDHVGLATWLCERWKVRLWMTVGEYGFARMMSAGLPGADGPSMIPHFRRHGLTNPDQLAQLDARKHYYPSLVPEVPLSFNRLNDRHPLRIGAHDWQVIIGNGHSPEHAALYCEALGVMVSGDMLLPRVSTNTSVFPVEPEADAVGQFLESLQQFLPLPADTLVLPSHGKPFRGLRERVAQLRAHHAARLDEVRAACVAPQSAADIVPIMFRRELDMHQMTFAMGEALAHLHRLWQTGELDRIEGSDGVLRFMQKR
jgi:glyoxylase-like metal-dependent hydrolase (beta-lactamase superfamily II)